MKRRGLLGVAACSALAPAVLRAGRGADAPGPRALREMQIIPVPALKLRIWVENQPPWEAALQPHPQQPSFVVQSPDNFHPPTVMNYWSWPAERVADAALAQVAQSAIRRASRNFGLDAAQARAVPTQAATHGVLSGFEGQFVGRVDGVAMDARVFVGQRSGRFPVVMSIYTLQGKMVHLAEVVRRGWGNVGYL